MYDITFTLRSYASFEELNQNLFKSSL